MVNLLFIEGLELDFFNPRSLVVFICILQGAVFAALLLARYFKQKKLADFWLASLLLLFCSSLITPLIGFANVYDRNQWLTYFPFNIAYGYSVCLWFYVLTLTDSNRRFERKDWLFFIPAGAYLIFRFALFAQSLDFKDWFDAKFYQPFVNPFVTVTEFVWNSIFLYFSIKHYRKYRAWLNENFSDTEKIKFDWLRNFLYVFTLIYIVSAIFDFTSSFIRPLSYIQYFYLEFILALCTYYLAIAGYLRSQTIELNFTESECEKIATPTDEPRKSLLSDSDLEKFKIKLRNLMAAEKPFLDSQLTSGNLAKQLGVNTTVLSYVINNGFGKNFNDFVNEFRIEEVKSRLTSNVREDINLLAVAYDSGFNSKATFNRAFKKSMGVSPKEFQEQKSLNS